MAGVSLLGGDVFLLAKLRAERGCGDVGLGQQEVGGFLPAGLSGGAGDFLTAGDLRLKPTGRRAVGGRRGCFCKSPLSVAGTNGSSVFAWVLKNMQNYDSNDLP